MCHSALGDPRGRREWSALPRRCQRPGPLLPKQLRRQVLAVREPVGGRERRKKRGLQLHWIPPCQGRGLRTSGGGRGGGVVEALLKVPCKLLQPMQIDHRVSVVLPDDGEILTFCGVDVVRCWRSGHRLAGRL
jgi:hypothetical protein